MNASKDGFFAADTWRNNISGSVKLIKQGGCFFKLSSKNTWRGGTLEKNSVSVFCVSNVHVSGGTLASNARLQLRICA